MSDELLTVEEFSIQIKAHRNTVYRGIKNGHIQAFRIGIGSRSSFRIPSSEIQRMAKFNLETIIKGINSGRSVLS